MKYPDALRVLCKQILERHLVAEREAFEVAGDDLLDNSADVGTASDSVGRAEFGSPLIDDLAIVIVAKAMKRVADGYIRSKAMFDSNQLIAKWEKVMVTDGIAVQVAERIAGEFGPDLVTYVQSERATRTRR